MVNAGEYERALIQDLQTYIHQSPTAWHAVATTAERLRKAGFSELREDQSWDIQPGRAYFTTRNGSSLCAFYAPEKLRQGRFLASHTDSPALKLKPAPARLKSGSLLLASEVYGGPILSSWFNRELCLAGRLVIETDKGLETQLFQTQNPIATIPHLAIHLEGSLATEHRIDKQDHLYALTGILVDKDTDSHLCFTQWLQEVTGNDHPILAQELFLVPYEPALSFGIQSQLLASYRLDNLLAAHANLEAFLALGTASHDCLKLWISWDNEEVGSSTAQGAGSPFLGDVLERLAFAYKLNPEERIMLRQRCHLLSNDAAHAIHPNYADKHEPTNAPELGKGPIVKLNAQQRYASDAEGEALLMQAARSANIPIQRYVSKNTVRCGSTIGPISSTLLGIKTLDIGSGLLSMHSARELCATQDHIYLCRLLTAWLDTHS